MAAGRMTQEDLLSTVKLRMNERLVQGHVEPGAIIMRSPGGKRRLIVTPAQAAILRGGFARWATVPEVLVKIIAENCCPPLREFYELVLQAHAAGVLEAEGAPAEVSQAVRWPVRISPRAALVLGAVIILPSLVQLAIAVPHWRGPGGWFEVAAGWLAACALLSLGELLAACAVARCGEVRAARFRWLELFPRFGIDTSEAMMGGKNCELAVAVLRTAPVLAGAAIVSARAPGWLAALLAGVLAVLAPWGGSAAMQAMAARRTAPRFSVQSGFLFAPVRDDPWARWGAAWRMWRTQFGLPGLGWAVLWCAGLSLVLVRCLHPLMARASDWLAATAHWHSLLLGALYFLIVAVALVLVTLAWAAVKHWRLKRAWSKPQGGAAAREPDRPPLVGDRVDVLRQVALFQGLPEESLAALAAAIEPVSCERTDEVISEDEAGEDFYVVVSGELEVRKRRPNSKRSATIGWMGPGECFGEIALLENTVRTATVVASRRTQLLRLGRAEFDRLVLERLGAATIRERLQHARFLGRLTFTAGLAFGDLIKFAGRCQNLRFDAGATPLVEGARNIWFYLIYDGAFAAREGERVVRRMGPGDYFGEISLLEAAPASATVVAIEESRCLALNRSDFLEFFARDFRIGLRMEAVAAQRLGSPLFASR